MTENQLEMDLKYDLYNLGVTNCTVKYKKDRFSEDLTILAHNLNSKHFKKIREYGFGNNYRQRIDSYNPHTGKHSHHKPLWLYGFIKVE